MRSIIRFICLNRQATKRKSKWRRRRRRRDSGTNLRTISRIDNPSSAIAVLIANVSEIRFKAAAQHSWNRHHLAETLSRLDGAARPSMSDKRRAELRRTRGLADTSRLQLTTAAAALQHYTNHLQQQHQQAAAAAAASSYNHPSQAASSSSRPTTAAGVCRDLDPFDHLF